MKIRKPWFLKTRRQKSAENQAKVRQDAKDQARKARSRVRSNGKKP